MEEILDDDDYFAGLDALGAEDDYGPPSPQQLMQANRPLTASEQGIVNQWNAQHPSFLQRPAFGGLKVWQAGLAGIGLVGVITGVGLLAFGRK